MDLTNIQPINVFEPQGSNTAQFSHHKDWIALYPEGSVLSRKLPLFGVYVPAKKLTKKTKTPQCGRCFGWHNERACARASRCRLCGSTQHLENEHISCDPTRPHDCPPRCINCHGPHPADALECLFRPKKDNSVPSKSEAARIRQMASAASLRIKVAHCSIISTQAPTGTVQTEVAIPSTPTEVRRLFTEYPSPSANRFAPCQPKPRNVVISANQKWIHEYQAHISKNPLHQRGVLLICAQNRSPTCFQH